MKIFSIRRGTLADHTITILVSVFDIIGSLVQIISFGFIKSNLKTWFIFSKSLKWIRKNVKINRKKILSSDDFNNKWKSKLDDNHYGMSIDDKDILKLVDNRFKEWERDYPDFKYQQIKMKFGSSRVYTFGIPTDECLNLEQQINEIFDIKRNE